MALKSRLSLLCRRSKERVRQKILDKDAIYSVEVTMPNGESSIFGGAVCVHPSGMLVTVAHIVPENHESVFLRRSSDPPTPFPAKIVQVWRHFDLCLLRICRRKTEEDLPPTTFGYVKLGSRPLSLDYGEPLFSYQPTSLLSGYTSYLFLPDQENSGFPATSDVRTVAGDPAYAEELFRQAQRSFQPYRTAATVARVVVDDDDCDLLHVHPHLPLVEAGGMRSHKAASGCPVFHSVDGRLVGVLVYPVDGRDYIIPASFIQSCVGPHLPAAKGKGNGKVVDGDGPSNDNCSEVDVGKKVKVGNRSFLERFLEKVQKKARLCTKAVFC